jgi:hypothetical protein
MWIAAYHACVVEMEGIAIHHAARSVRIMQFAGFEILDLRH